MKKQKERYERSQELPLLTPKHESDIGSVICRSKSIHRRIRLGWLATLIAVCVCVGILLIVVSGSFASSSPRLPAQIAGWLTALEFMSISVDCDADKEEQASVESGMLEGVLLPDYNERESEIKDSMESEGTDAPSVTPITWESLYQFNATDVPEGEIPIVPMDLSLTKFGPTYINNATGLKPDVETLLAKELEPSSSLVYLSKKDEPQVLILHTHGTEAYSLEGQISYSDTGGELARSEDIEQNVVAVGKVLADALNEAGIVTLHCTVMHDQLQYKDSYARSEQTIRRYLEAYPSIRLVIDLHRDSILRSDGELVRPVTLTDDQPTAQVMCVVGSNWNGADHPNWEKNLSLALKLRVALNESHERLCRPVYLKSSTYNQELAPYSLLLEIGASGNSLQEAKRAALCVAEALRELIPKL